MVACVQDVDRFVEAHRPTWTRLDELAGRAALSPRRLAAPELAELVSLYQLTSTHLSQARTHLHDEVLVAELTRLVARAGAAVYGHRPRTWRSPVHFFAVTFPAALWRIRWFVLAAALLFLVPAIATGAWVATTPAARDALIPPALQDAYVNEDFAAYYTATPSGVFFAQVGFNNAQVGMLAFAGGVLAGVPTALVLAYNGFNVGGAGGLFHFYGVQEVFYGLIAPHGLLELTAVFVAGGAGLALGWSLLVPGDRTRGQALGEEGRRAFVVVLGLVVVFLVAAVIEAFVTGRPWPTWLRVGIGVVVEVTFLVYWLVIGRARAAEGWTGALGEADDAGWL